jgi:hypothetical protein
MIIHHCFFSWAGIPPPIYPRGRFGIIFTLFVICSTGARVAWLIANMVIGCEDRVRDEAPAVWEYGGWAVQGLKPSGTQGRQIRRTA